MASNLYFGHGEAWLANRNTTTGNPTDFDVALPAIDALSIELGREIVEHVSKRTSIAGKDLKLTRMLSASIKMTVATHTKELLATYLYGTVNAVAGGAFTNVPFEVNSITAGQTVRLPGGRKHVSSLVIKDSAGTPATLTPGTHYNVIDLDAGLVKFINITGFTQPFTASGTEGAGSRVSLLTQRTLEKFLLFKGINIANDDKVVLVELYRVQIEPANSWTLLNDGNNVNAYEINGEVLIDSTKPSDPVLGQYGNYKELT